MKVLEQRERQAVISPYFGTLAPTHPLAILTLDHAGWKRVWYGYKGAWARAHAAGVPVRLWNIACSCEDDFLNDKGV